MVIIANIAYQNTGGVVLLFTSWIVVNIADLKLDC